MNKVEVLEELQERIKEEGIIKGQYFAKEGDTCRYCTVGHLMKIAGIDVEKLVSRDEDYNEMQISRLCLWEPQVGQKLSKLGFSEDELRGLQFYNDTYADVRAVSDFIEDMIMREEGISYYE